MAEAILVPQVGQDLTEATVVELHVAVGDTVKKGDLVAVVESEKASFEVEAFAEGVVIDLPYKEGDIAEVLAPLMHLGAPGETLTKEAHAKAPVVEKAASGAAVMRIEDAVAGQAMVAAGGRVRSSPVARRMASGSGLDLALVSGSGPGGAVVLRDVTRALEAAPAARGQVAGGAGLALTTLQAGAGAPLVLLHGFGGDISAWRPSLALLSLPCPILALDLPGHGGSAGHAATSFDEIVGAVGAALAGIGGPLHIAGHSLGAAVALAASARGDLDLRSLTLLAPAGLGPSIDAAFLEGFLSAKSEPALTAWMRRLVHDPATLAPVLVRATLAARDQPGLVEAQKRVARGLFEGGTQLFSVAGALAQTTVPCTVVLGRNDVIVSPVESMAQIPGHVALHRLEGTGHLPQLERAELTHRLIALTMRAAA